MGTPELLLVKVKASVVFSSSLPDPDCLQLAGPTPIFLALRTLVLKCSSTHYTVYLLVAFAQRQAAAAAGQPCVRRAALHRGFVADLPTSQLASLKGKSGRARQLPTTQ